VARLNAGVEFPPAVHLVVICPTQARAEAARPRAAQVLGTIGLRLHPDTTRPVSSACPKVKAVSTSWVNGARADRSIARGSHL
jgi:hypothetical protein